MIPLQALLLTFVVLFGLGTALTLPLYHFNYQKLLHSQLFVKILFWIPIFLVFLGILYAPGGVRLGGLAALILLALVEYARVIPAQKDKLLLTAYFIFFVAGLAHFGLIAQRYPAHFIDLLITLCFATVLSDVAAFFLGNYAGKHKLPLWLNSNKSWEGVIGQVVGGLVGVLLVRAFIVRVPTVWLFLPLGLGSAVGDLANSFAKRRARIKDWSNAIPGHGGFIDRLSSAAGSCVAVYYFLILSGMLR